MAPGETAVVLGGVVAAHGEVDLVPMLLLVWVAAAAGDFASFLLGRRLGRRFLVNRGPRFGVTAPRLAQVERFFDRHGPKAILVGRFVGLVRAVAPFLAGSSGMRLRAFLPWSILGTAAWAATFTLVGYIFHRSFSAAADYVTHGAFALAVVGARRAGMARAPFATICGVTTPAELARDADERSEEIVTVLADAFGDLIEADERAFRRKFRKMAASPFAFYRGSAPLFYADVGPTRRPVGRRAHQPRVDPGRPARRELRHLHGLGRASSSSTSTTSTRPTSATSPGTCGGWRPASRCSASPRRSPTTRSSA